MWYTKPEEVDLSEFNPDGDYTDRQLEAYADAMLKEDIKASGNVNNILFEEHLAARRRREVYARSQDSNGTVDEAITTGLPKTNRPGVHAGDGQMMYNRTHPSGRKVNSKEQRLRNGASYYRN